MLRRDALYRAESAYANRLSIRCVLAYNTAVALGVKQATTVTESEDESDGSPRSEEG